MSVLLYSAEKKAAGQRIQRVLEVLVAEERREIYRTIEDVAIRLRRPVYDIDVAILLAITREELRLMMPLRELLDDVRIILVLPDRGRDTIAKGHSLRPRFLTYADSDFVDVGAVLGRMLEKSKPAERVGGQR